MRGASTLATLRLAAGIAVHTTLGRLRGKTYVPHPRTMLFIEPCTRCNLLCSFCTYRMNLRPHTAMAAEVFEDVVGQATAMGFRDIVLTPTNGDAFMDKGILGKMRHVEGLADGPGMLLYTNLIAASAEALAEILAMRRLKQFIISVYGHDFETFRRISGRGDEQFRRLLANIATVEDIVREKGRPPGLSVCVRTERRWRVDSEPGGELHTALSRLIDLGVPVLAQSSLDDWGGLISEGDLNGMDMTLIKGAKVPKRGACILPFFNPQVLTDGRVHACACRDIGAELVIGDLRRQSLAHILSAANPAYVSLIERQQRGDFPASCRGCSFYRSIYDSRIAGASPLGTLTLEEFWTALKPGGA